MPDKLPSQLTPYVPSTSYERDALVAAPLNHEVIIENDLMRVLRVTVRAGEIEKKHRHTNPSIFMGNVSSNMDYYNEKGGIVARSGKRKDGEPFWVDLNGIRWLENHDTFAFDAFRVEIKT